ncbi:MAG: hypothetical protein GEV03_26990 [Streptosporangiales bacterium]|nr:hypothetical protein [Streptosporangiales bacterium]
MSRALRPVPPSHMRATLRRSAGVGQLFALAVDTGAAVDTAAGEPAWRRHEELLGPSGTELTSVIDAVRGQLGGGERRVAASMFVMGYATRLLAPALAGMLLDHRLPDLRPTRVRWRYLPGEGLLLCCPAAAGWEPASGAAGVSPALLERLRVDLVDGHLAPLLDAVRGVVPVSSALLWGNVASSAAGALRMLALHGAGTVAECESLGERLLAAPPLSGTGQLAVRSRREVRQLFFVRRNCCLYYRLPGGGKCGDCVLLDAGVRERQWQDALRAADDPDPTHG